MNEWKDRFADPPALYRPAPLWVWNDDMTEEQIRDQLGRMKARGFGGAFVHPRPGLVTAYLSEAWFELWGKALEAADKLDLKLYLYDENSYPSGFAGGHVPSRMPDGLAGALTARLVETGECGHLRWESALSGAQGRLLSAYAVEGGNGSASSLRLKTEVTKRPPSEWPSFGNRFLLLEWRIPETSAWLGGFAYPDLLRPEAARHFLETTHEAYRARFGDRFGERIPALFTDEPCLVHGHFPDAQPLPFSYWFASQFEQRNGYSLIEHLPCLFADAAAGDGKAIDPLKVRYDYYDTLRELWANNWVKPISDWCELHGLAFTGHYLEHNWPYPWGRSSPSVMSFYEYMHWPGIDMLLTSLLKENGRDPHLLVTIREAHSAANQLGRKRVLCEAYGAGGWDSTFEDFRRIGDWLYVHGINFLNPHLTLSSIAGARKRDYPQSFDWRQPWWEPYGKLNDYFARLSVALGEGETRNRILVLNPTTSFYMKTPDLAEPGLEPNHAEPLSSDVAILQLLSERQWDFDLGDEFIAERHGRTEGASFVIGQGKYEVVVIPAAMENVRESTMQLLGEYLSQGGKVLALGSPTRIEGNVAEERLEQLKAHEGWMTVENAEALERTLHSFLSQRLTIASMGTDEDFTGWSERSALAHLRREQTDGSVIWFVVNSGPKAFQGNLRLKGEALERLNPWTGAAEPAVYRHSGDGTLEMHITLEASGSLLLRSGRASDKMIPPLAFLPGERSEEEDNGQTLVMPAISPTIVPEESNVWPLAYCDLKIGSETHKDIHVLFAASKVFEFHGFEANPWDNAIQYRSRLTERDKEFGELSGFEVSYRFFISEGSIPSRLGLLVERGDAYQILVNGAPLNNGGEKSRLDDHFREYNIVSLVREGDNVVTLRVSPFSVLLEVEAVVLLGDFAVSDRGNRWEMERAKPLRTGSWGRQGYPFYGGAVVYSRSVELPDTIREAQLVLGDWNGTVASIAVNGKYAGLLGVDGSVSIDLMPHVLPGKENFIEVRVCGSFKNLLGPHHHPDRPRKVGWSYLWQSFPIQGSPKPKEYDLIAYGLMSDYRIVVRTENGE
ncbi:glycosyl hydrolase [Cohnella silvisoli]|uniref:Glycosyl hydrolase n=1 Tax=Cohnella silvisoli TaxID=2873699 RepID=A0ABV1KSP1_9BACL|nr:glycosyl hydrolase [Cohnella silvisoli]MCD9022503.1 hypothetical protein [Cohnella silvisoli]